MTSPRALAALWLPLLIGGLAPCAAHAHQVRITEAGCKFEADGRYRIVILADAASYLYGAESGDVDRGLVERLSDDASGALQEILETANRNMAEGIHVRFNGVRVTPETIRLPTAQEVREDFEKFRALGAMPVVIVEMEGRAPDGAGMFTIAFPEAISPVEFSVGFEDARAVRQLLRAGQAAWPFPLSAEAGTPPPAPPWPHVVADYLVLGFEHILPRGLDHILFVLGLFMLSPRLRPLLWQVTAFTVAHTLTLGLAMYGVVSLSPRIVEPLIALSIALVAVENLCTVKLHPWRPPVVFLFGLLHGLGFAGVLIELGLPEGRFVAALVAFNVGVEFGQLSVLALAFLAVGWFRRRTWYRPWVAIPASCLIAAMGLYWFVERVVAQA